ncbi:helix-hairpin-helix domain-containing protein [Nocardioides mangrovi]|uniref:ComEA family DNA-binding protein n=1 Tax=Nocardioides mangrovi TaxID=2874580 RepID=A0ABS7U6U6_9ACTN|nr:ComEA family DNA-binding protein [Nocardioides mangrovi]MBZ5736698.1 ComEA family DNA-binding protein [Nocardioides mangrovi]
MPNRRPTPDHQEAVSRRLALLSAELAGERRPVAEPADDWTAGHTRIRPAAPPEPVELPVVPVPPVPVPGRHASRRGPDGALASLRGRVALGPPQLAVLALGVAVALAVTCWWLVRGDPEPVEAPVLEPAAATDGSALPGVSPVAATTSPDGGSGGGSVTVDVEGKVRSTGIVVLDEGARVVDALDAAGGARPGVDLTGLNLARVLVDGEQIVVGVTPPPGVAAGATPSAGATAGPLVDLNTASETELEALPEIGPVTAAAIVAWREENGGFSSVDDLLDVDGIGDATLAEVAPLVTV